MAVHLLRRRSHDGRGPTSVFITRRAAGVRQRGALGLEAAVSPVSAVVLVLRVAGVWDRPYPLGEMLRVSSLLQPVQHHLFLVARRARPDRARGRRRRTGLGAKVAGRRRRVQALRDVVSGSASEGVRGHDSGNLPVLGRATLGRFVEPRTITPLPLGAACHTKLAPAAAVWGTWRQSRDLR